MELLRHRSRIWLAGDLRADKLDDLLELVELALASAPDVLNTAPPVIGVHIVAFICH